MFPFHNGLNVYIPLIFLCVVNIIFTFSGIVLNTLVIVNVWKSSQLRKKLCLFHYDGVVVFRFGRSPNESSSNPTLYYLLIKGGLYDLLSKMKIYLYLTSVLLAFSFVTLIVISIERYLDLGAYFPIFHQASCCNETKTSDCLCNYLYCSFQKLSSIYNL